MTKNLVDRFVAGVQSATRETTSTARRAGCTARRATGEVLVLHLSHGRQADTVAEARRLPVPVVGGGAQACDRPAESRGRRRHRPGREKRTPPAPEPVPAPVFTFADPVPVYLAFQRGRVKTWQAERSKITTYLLPAWGTIPLRDITRTHVHELLDTVAGKGLTVGVNRLQALISRLFTVALDRSLIDAHPAARMIKRFAETASTRTLTDDEIRALWAGLERQPGGASDAIRLGCYSGNAATRRLACGGAKSTSRRRSGRCRGRARRTDGRIPWHCRRRRWLCSNSGAPVSKTARRACSLPSPRRATTIGRCP